MPGSVLQISTTDLTPVFALLTLCITTVGAIAMAWIAYKQAALAKSLSNLHDSTNSKMDVLLKNVENAAFARGQLAGPHRSDPAREKYE